MKMERATSKKSKWWTEEETNTLVDNVEANYGLIKSRLSDTVTNKKKPKCWADISNKLNAVGVCHRTTEQVKKKWEDLKSRTMSKATSMNREDSVTGGGQKLKIELTNLERRILSLLGETAVKGLPGAIDTDELSPTSEGTVDRGSDIDDRSESYVTVDIALDQLAEDHNVGEDDDNDECASNSFHIGHRSSTVKKKVTLSTSIPTEIENKLASSTTIPSAVGKKLTPLASAPIAVRKELTSSTNVPATVGKSNRSQNQIPLVPSSEKTTKSSWKSIPHAASLRKNNPEKTSEIAGQSSSTMVIELERQKLSLAKERLDLEKKRCLVHEDTNMLLRELLEVQKQRLEIEQRRVNNTTSSMSIDRPRGRPSTEGNIFDIFK